MKPFTANAHQAAAFARLPMGGEMLFIVPWRWIITVKKVEK